MSQGSFVRLFFIFLIDLILNGWTGGYSAYSQVIRFRYKCCRYPPLCCYCCCTTPHRAPLISLVLYPHTLTTATNHKPPPHWPSALRRHNDRNPPSTSSETRRGWGWGWGGSSSSNKEYAGVPPPRRIHEPEPESPQHAAANHQDVYIYIYTPQLSHTRGKEDGDGGLAREII